jgi:transketolase
MRDAFSSTLVEIAENDSSVLLLTGDHGYALFDEFRKQCPSQYINAGIAEQNMVGMAAGLARAGFRPFVYGLSAFVPIRVLEQIKLDVAHDHLPVVFIGDGAGFVYSHLGTSHQSTEDISCCRAIPNLSILSPADAAEMQACMRLAYASHSPVYLRMGKSDKGMVHPQPVSPEKLNAPLQVHTSRDESIAFLATGSMVTTAISLAQVHFPQASVWSVPRIKPMGYEQLVDSCRTAKHIVCLEEHSIYGGLGSVVSEILSTHLPKKILRIGVNDRFSHLCGTYEYLLHEHGLNLKSIKQKIDDFIKD